MMTLKKVCLLGLALWPVFLVTAVSLGAVREGLIAPALGEQAAHVISTLLFVSIMLAIQFLFVGKVRGYVRQRDLWLIGVIWTLMTVCFEFGFFHFVAGVPWEKLLADYNIFAGRLWLLVLLTTLCGPPLLGRWHDKTIKSNKTQRSDRHDSTALCQLVRQFIYR